MTHCLNNNNNNNWSSAWPFTKQQFMKAMHWNDRDSSSISSEPEHYWPFISLYQEIGKNVFFYLNYQLLLFYFVTFITIASEVDSSECGSYVDIFISGTEWISAAFVCINTFKVANILLSALHQGYSAKLLIAHNSCWKSTVQWADLHHLLSWHKFSSLFFFNKPSTIFHVKDHLYSGGKSHFVSLTDYHYYYFLFKI